MVLERASHDFIDAEQLVVVAGEAPHKQPSAGVDSQVDLPPGRRQPDLRQRIAYCYSRAR